MCKNRLSFVNLVDKIFTEFGDFIHTQIEQNICSIREEITQLVERIE